jgi:rubredoxin-NAD+ reductase
MSSGAGILVIGSGMAGYTLLREIRKLDSDVALTLICADSGDFYSKPMLSNALAANKTAEQLVTQPAAAITDSLNVRLFANTRVERIDSAARQVFSVDQSWSYDSLVLATGANPIRLPMVGTGADDILSVNHLDDYRRFRQQLGNAGHIAIIGPGLIGCEFANDLVASGTRVSVIGPDAWPISTLLPEAGGRFLQQNLEAAGVTFFLGNSVESVNRATNGFNVALKNGETLQCDLVLSAIGLRADSSLAESAGLDTGRGYRVDACLQTNCDGIYALGDCAEVNGFNLPFIMPIMFAARALAKTLTGQITAVSYPAMPVAIKTPACPLVVAPPAPDEANAWTIETSPSGVKALCYRDDSLVGFALAGDAVSEKQALARALPAVF